MKKALASLKCEDVETAIKQNKGQRESVRGGGWRRLKTYLDGITESKSGDWRS